MWEREGLLWMPYVIVTQRCHSTDGPGKVGSCTSTHIFPHSSSKSSYPSLQAHTLTGGWGTWRAAARPDTVIKNGCWAERECQHDAAITYSCEGKKGEKTDCCLDVALIGGILIMVSKKSVLRDRMVPGEDLHDWCFLHGSLHHVLVIQSAQQKKKTHTVPDDKCEMWSLKYWMPIDLHGSINRK